MGLLFQPRWSGDRPDVAGTGAPAPPTRRAVLEAALVAVVVGDGSAFPDLFTPDVTFCSPHVELDSLAAVLRVLGSPEEALTEIAIEVVGLDEIGDKLIAEWRLDARFTRPLLFDDGLLIEPTGACVHLPGASVARFRGHRIRAIRHYFDDSELMHDIPQVPGHVRWIVD